VAGKARLNALEASFLALDRPGMPMHVAGLVLLDASSRAGGPLTPKELRRLVASRLLHLPGFRHRIGGGTLGLLRPELIEVEELDLEAHLFHHRLGAAGRMSQLNALCGRIHAEPLRRDRPLWEIHLVDGLAGDRQALIVKTHHAIADGIAAVKIAEALFDKAGRTGRHRDGLVPAPRFAGPGKPTALGLAQTALGIAYTAAGGPIARPGPFNGPVGPRRAFATATIAMDVIRALKSQLGGSVDDILLAAVAAGLGRHLRKERYPGLPRKLRAMIPVSTWPPAPGELLGNHVSAVFVDLPLADADLPALVRSIAASKSDLRNTHAAAGMAMLIDAAGWMPRPVHEAIVRVAAALPTANLVLSDIPGPQGLQFLAGRPIFACYPMIPLPPTVGLSVAALSMAGQMGVGLISDPDLVPDPHHLAAEIEAAVRVFERSQLARPFASTSPPAHRRAARAA